MNKELAETIHKSGEDGKRKYTEVENWIEEGFTKDVCDCGQYYFSGSFSTD
jgi:hypothetical protein